MGHGNPRVRRRRHTGRDTGNDLEGDARARESQRLLASTTEHERIAALQTNHASPFASEANQQFLDVLLTCGAFTPTPAPTPTLPDEVAFRSRGDSVAGEDLGIHQRVEHYGVAVAEELARPHREQTRVARTGAHQVDDTHLLRFGMHQDKMGAVSESWEWGASPSLPHGRTLIIAHERYGSEDGSRRLLLRRPGTDLSTGATQWPLRTRRDDRHRSARGAPVHPSRARGRGERTRRGEAPFRCARVLRGGRSDCRSRIARANRRGAPRGRAGRRARSGVRPARDRRRERPRCSGAVREGDQRDPGQVPRLGAGHPAASPRAARGRSERAACGGGRRRVDRRRVERRAGRGSRRRLTRRHHAALRQRPYPAYLPHLDRAERRTRSPLPGSGDPPLQQGRRGERRARGAAGRHRHSVRCRSMGERRSPEPGDRDARAPAHRGRPHRGEHSPGGRGAQGYLRRRRLLAHNGRARQSVAHHGARDRGDLGGRVSRASLRRRPHG